jgi:hypothetical protein
MNDEPTLTIPATADHAVAATLELAAKQSDPSEQRRIIEIALAMLSYRDQAHQENVTETTTKPTLPGVVVIPEPDEVERVMTSHFIAPHGTPVGQCVDNTPDDFDALDAPTRCGWVSVNDLEVVARNNIQSDLIDGQGRDLFRSWIEPVDGIGTVLRVAPCADGSTIHARVFHEIGGMSGPVLAYESSEDYVALFADRDEVVLAVRDNGVETLAPVYEGSIAEGVYHDWMIHRHGDTAVVEVDHVPVAKIVLTDYLPRVGFRWGWTGVGWRLHQARITASVLGLPRVYVDPAAADGGDGSTPMRALNDWYAVDLSKPEPGLRVLFRRGSRLRVHADTNLSLGGSPTGWHDDRGFVVFDTYDPSVRNERVTVDAWATVHPAEWVQTDAFGEWSVDRGNSWLVVRVNKQVINGAGILNSIDGVSPVPGSLGEFEYRSLRDQNSRSAWRTTIRLPANKTPADYHIEFSRPTGWINAVGASGVKIRNAIVTGFSWSRSPIHHGYNEFIEAGDYWWVEHVCGEVGHSLANFGGQGGKARDGDAGGQPGESRYVRQWNLDARLMDWRCFGSAGPHVSSRVRDVSVFNVRAEECFTFPARGGDYEFLMAGPGDEIRARFLIQRDIGWPPGANGGVPPKGPYKPVGFGMHPGGINSDSAVVDAAFMFVINGCRTLGAYANGAKKDAKATLHNVWIDWTDPSQLDRMPGGRSGLAIAEARYGWTSDVSVSHVTMTACRLHGTGFLEGLAVGWAEDASIQPSRYPETMGLASFAKVRLTDSVLLGIEAVGFATSLVDRQAATPELMRIEPVIDRNVYQFGRAGRVTRVLFDTLEAQTLDVLRDAVSHGDGEPGPGWGIWKLDQHSQVIDAQVDEYVGGYDAVIVDNHGAAALDILLRPRVNNRPGAFD